jgi:hypothetical protein
MSNGYDLEGARAADISDEESLNHLAKEHGYDLVGARASGVADSESLSHLAGLPSPIPTAPPKQVEGPDVLPNIGAGTEGVVFRYGVGVPAAWGIKKLLGETTGTAPAADDLGSIKKWHKKETNNPFAGGRTKEEAYLKSEIAAGKPIQTRGSNIGIRKGNLGINNQIVEPSIPQKIVGGLSNLPQTKAGKAFTAGYNAMDVMEHAGEGTLGNVQAGASALAAAAPYAEKYLPGKFKALAPIAALGVPAANYAIDLLRSKFGPTATAPSTPNTPLVPQQAAGGSVQHFENGGLAQPENSAYVGYPQINRNRQEGYGTGYLNTLALAMDPTGLTAAVPEANASILSETPKERSYREGKEAAQPIAEVIGNLQMLNFGKQLAKPVVKYGAAKAGKLFNQARNLNIPQGMAGGGDVVKTGANLAKKLVSGYLEHTPKKPNPLVGTRFHLEDLGGVNPVTPLDISKIKGAMMTASPADMTSANQRILNIAGIPMTQDIVTHGGHPFARSQKNIERGHGWASNKNAAESAQSRADIAAVEGEMLGGTGQANMLPMTMGKGSENFSVPVAQSYYDIFKQAEFNPNEIQKMNEEIRNYKVRSKTPLQGFLGVEHPEVMQQMLQGGYGLEGSHHDLRKAFIERAQIKDRMRAMGVNAEDIAGAHLDPNLLGVPQGYVGHTVLQSKPGAQILPSDSTTYSHALQKEYLGDIGNIPASVLLEKPYKNIYQELQAKFPDKTEDQIHAMTLGAMGTRKAGVSQLVDDETINRVGAYHEAVKQGAINPNDYKSAMDYLSAPGRYAEGGEV